MKKYTSYSNTKVLKNFRKMKSSIQTLIPHIKKYCIKFGSILQKINMYVFGVPFYIIERWLGIIILSVYGIALTLSTFSYGYKILYNPLLIFQYKDTIVATSSAFLALSALLLIYCLTMIQIVKKNDLKIIFLINANRFLLGTLKIFIGLAIVVITPLMFGFGQTQGILSEVRIGDWLLLLIAMAISFNMASGAIYIFRGFVSLYRRSSFDLLLHEGKHVDAAHKKYLEEEIEIQSTKSEEL